MKGKVKIKTKMKAARRVAACALLLALLLPGAIALSQTDSFFYIDESDYRGGDNTGGTGSWLGLGDNTGGTGSWLGFGENTGGEASWEGFEEGNPLPTGAGLLALTVSGLCYAGLKRRKIQNSKFKDSKIQRLRKVKSKIRSKMKLKQKQKSTTMRRTLLMIAAVALLLTQCRKPSIEFPTPSSAEGVTVSMTVTAGPGSKTNIDADGRITWSSGDKLYVGDGSKCIGCLTLQGAGGSATGTFSGNVTLPTGTKNGEQTFHFFYLGSNPPEVTSSAQSVEVSFAEQTGLRDNLGSCHIGYGTAQGTVVGSEVTGINVTLVSKVALARFSFKKSGTSEGYSGALTLSGDHIYNSMKVNFGGTFTGEKTDGGEISLTDGTSSEKYVMLVPVGTESETLSFAGDVFDGSITLGSGIEPNKFYGRDGAMEVKLTPKFTVGMDNGKPRRVEFSPGNLWYDGTAFHFETNQWDTEPTAVDQTSSSGTWSSSHVSHFLWSPKKDVAVGTSTSVSGSTNDVFFTNATETTANPGFHVNGETGENQWRTLSKAEWSYLIGESSPGRAKSLCKWSAVTFGDSGPTVRGLIIMPDGWEGTLSATTDYTTWQSLASSGAVFLPAAGRRYGENVSDVGEYGHAWSSTPKTTQACYYMVFRSTTSVQTDFYYRYYGRSVRLVRAAQ